MHCIPFQDLNSQIREASRELCKGLRTCSSVASLLLTASTTLPHPISKAAPKNLLPPRTAFPLKPYSLRSHPQTTVSCHSLASNIPAVDMLDLPSLDCPCFPCLWGSFWPEDLLYPASSPQSGIRISPASNPRGSLTPGLFATPALQNSDRAII